MVLNATAILKSLLYTGIFSHLLPLVFFLLFKRNSKEKTLRVILFYVIYCILNEALSYYLQSTKNENFVILLSTFTIIEYSFFCYFIYQILPKNPARKLVPIAWMCFLSFAFIDFFYVNKMGGFDSFAIGIESIVIIVFCIYYLYLQIKNANDLMIYSTFNFWIIITFLIYFAGTFFLYIMTENMVYDVAFQKLYFIINISFNILKNILLCIAMTMRTDDSSDKNKLNIALPELDDEIFFQPKK